LTLEVKHCAALTFVSPSAVSIEEGWTGDDNDADDGEKKRAS